MIFAVGDSSISPDPFTELCNWRIKPGCIQSNTSGSRTTCGLRMTNGCPVANMLPQSAVGGWVPRSRNESHAVARIFAPRLKATITGEMICGTMWRTRMRRSGLSGAPGLHELAPAQGEHAAAHQARVE